MSKLFSCQFASLDCVKVMILLANNFRPCGYCNFLQKECDNLFALLGPLQFYHQWDLVHWQQGKQKARLEIRWEYSPSLYHLEQKKGHGLGMQWWFSNGISHAQWSDALILCEWHSWGYDPIHSCPFQFGLPRTIKLENKQGCDWYSFYGLPDTGGTKADPACR
jgi:hypothetical protein